MISWSSVQLNFSDVAPEQNVIGSEGKAVAAGILGAVV